MKTIWHKGEPPHVGWWNASTRRNDYAWRWWDGKYWSSMCTRSMSKETVAKFSQIKSRDDDEIEWTNYYPKNARVPRIKP